MELRCSHDLALRLGAVEPTSIEQARELKKGGHIIVRGHEGQLLFWPVAKGLTAVMRQYK